MRGNDRGRPARALAGALTIAALLTPAAAGAQDPLGEPAPERERERCICFDDMRERIGERVMAPHVFMRGSRGRLGIMLGDPAEVGGRPGVRVVDVVEGGPAARAGIAAGDIIVALRGEPLGAEPTRRLLELMEDAEPGDTVAVRFSHEGQERTARVVLEEDTPFAFRIGGDGMAWSAPGEARVRAPMVFPGQGPSVVTIDAFGHGGLELVEVNPELGRYFGVERGVLVADVEDDSRLGLQAGDVVVSIGGRDVRSPRHARSIIGSYLPDESIEMQVVRDRKTLTVRGTRGR